MRARTRSVRADMNEPCSAVVARNPSHLPLSLGATVPLVTPAVLRPERTTGECAWMPHEVSR